MKNLLLFCICFLLIGSVNAQFEKGQKMLGGQFSFYDQKTESSNSTPTNISSDLNTSFAYSRFSNPTTIKSYGVHLSYSDNGSTTINKTVGAFYNYTKLESLAKRLYLSYGATAAINFTEYNNSYTNYYRSNQSSTVPSVSIGLGLMYHLNNRFLISASLLNLATLSYSFNNTETFPANNPPYTTKNNTVSLNTGLTGYSLSNIGLGFNYLLKKK
jgi:hypothetical protein